MAKSRQVSLQAICNRKETKLHFDSECSHYPINSCNYVIKVALIRLGKWKRHGLYIP